MTGPDLIIVFGATGDLARRKLLPAVHSMLGPEGVKVLAVAGSPHDDDGYRRIASEALVESGVPEGAAAAWARDTIWYQDVPRQGSYQRLADRIQELESSIGASGNRVIYLALPPDAVEGVVAAIGEAGINQSAGWVRLVVEKPFGSDLGSAHALNEALHACFAEDQIYRIDHYLGKETVRNLLVFRFTNPIFEASWNRDRIDRVEITVAEAVGIGGRGRYYDAAGVIRDVVQSHLTQILTLVAMESPPVFGADAVRDEKVKVLRSIREIPEAAVVLGQYGSGAVAGERVAPYTEDEGVAPDSPTPTYAAVRVWIDNWRWQGVPFYLRTGKAMDRRLTEVAVTFRRPPVCLFHSIVDDCIKTNDVLRLVLQPDEGFELSIDVKEPGDSTKLLSVPLHFSYADAFGRIPDAYETLLVDVIEGDQTLFVRADEVEQAWRLFTPVVGYDLAVHPYPAGSWGPEAAVALLPAEAGGWATP